jgi:hypothetical protein
VKVSFPCAIFINHDSSEEVTVDSGDKSEAKYHEGQNYLVIHFFADNQWELQVGCTIRFGFEFWRLHISHSSTNSSSNSSSPAVSAPHPSVLLTIVRIYLRWLPAAAFSPLTVLLADDDGESHSHS